MSSKASGLDNIGPSILKNSASILSRPLHYLFSLSLTSGKIPTEWKIHTIVPVFKSGDKTSVKNYRPIISSIMFPKFWNDLYTIKSLIILLIIFPIINLDSSNTNLPYNSC